MEAARRRSAICSEAPSPPIVFRAESVIAQSGVRHGKFHPIPVEIDSRNAKHHHAHARPHT